MAQKYRKKPKDVYAFQWKGVWSDVIEWLTEIGPVGPFLVPVGGKPGIIREGDALRLETVNGPSHAQLGDWVVPEPEPNRFYPIREDVFASDYEAV